MKPEPQRPALEQLHHVAPMVVDHLRALPPQPPVAPVLCNTGEAGAPTDAPSSSGEATKGLWQRILSPGEPAGSLLPVCPEGGHVGFANYVLHAHTWSLRPVCYLEDLFVASAARGEGARRALLEALVTLGREHGWRRVYWHTHENNERARTLYDQLAKRTDYVRYDIEF